MSETQIRIRIEDQEDLDAAYELADQYPQLSLRERTRTPAAGVESLVEPVTAVLIAAGVTLVAKYISDWWDKRRGGLVLDQREDAEDQIYRDKDLPFGYIVIYPADGGEVKLETKDSPKDSIHQLLESVIGGVFKSVTDIAKAASEAVGKEKVEVVPS